MLDADGTILITSTPSRQASRVARRNSSGPSQHTDIAGVAFNKGAVTVIDTTTGVSKKVPWEKGLSLSKIETAGRVIEVVRGSQKIQTTAETILKPGDIVRTQ